MNRRLWRFAASFAVWIAIARFFGMNVYATLATATLFATFIWLIGSFFFGVWKGWRE